MKQLLTYVLVAGIVIGGIWGSINIVKYPELYITTAKKDLMIQLEEGNDLAIEYYVTQYIENDKYIFDGPITAALMAQRYGIDTAKLSEMYEESGYETLQEFYENVIKPEINPI